ncbi:hypothetical protein WR25_07443 [Diploscapter pachys]|uniref:GP-PDE domain-containing protein n=1 Tax=Diploscapter pachys TaxID=2018661 RepID=A0A2A2JT97_9BILA|nr:hypothetical protein WR25_07443 [Diploscapter pachys]
MLAPRPTVRIRFAVELEGGLAPTEFVMVTGSHKLLGQWDPQQAMLLTQDEEKSTRWRGFIDINDDMLKFRYFVAYKLASADGEERLIISRWEAFLHPRSVLCKAEERNGECRTNHIDIFGYYAGRKCISDGWLIHTDENQILLRVHGNAIKFYKSATKDRKHTRIKITSLDVRTRQTSGAHISFNTGEDEEEPEEDDPSLSALPTHSWTDVAVLSNSNPKFIRQDDAGVMFSNNKDYIVFKTHSTAVEFLAFYIEVFNEEKKRIGACYALPSSMADTFGTTQLPFINSSGRPIGQISLEYLFVRSLHKPISPQLQLMDVSYSRHWKKRNNPLEVGHRGAGNSYTKFASVRENTIHSLDKAASHGADYVEFDVQLTKDKVAVIYHDFHVLVNVARRSHSVVDLPKMDEDQKELMERTDYHEIAVKDLKLRQLKLLMLDHINATSKKDSHKLVVDAEEQEEMKPFPTLVEVLQKVDSDVGFNVEVKYPMMQKNGLHECEGITMKQNKYPVLFLCVGDTQRYTPFQDQRTSTSLTAVNFAAGADLLGVDFNSEDLLKDPYPVKRANDFGLVTFVWGEDLDIKENINYFKKELGVDGVIYDRIGEDEGRRNVFIVEREQKKLLLNSSGNSTPQRPASPIDLVLQPPSGATIERRHSDPTTTISEQEESEDGESEGHPEQNTADADDEESGNTAATPIGSHQMHTPLVQISHI